MKGRFEIIQKRSIPLNTIICRTDRIKNDLVFVENIRFY